MVSELDTKPSLLRVLSLPSTIAIVVGSMIGSGIFVITPSMARNGLSAPWLLVVWSVAGVLTIFGALTQSELASRFPKTGGLYTYLKEIYGDGVGFFYGWANFMIAGSGAIAAIALASLFRSTAPSIGGSRRAGRNAPCSSTSTMRPAG